MERKTIAFEIPIQRQTDKRTEDKNTNLEIPIRRQTDKRKRWKERQLHLKYLYRDRKTKERDGKKDNYVSRTKGFSCSLP
jgi:hypothetical protein